MDNAHCSGKMLRCRKSSFSRGALCWGRVHFVDPEKQGSIRQYAPALGVMSSYRVGYSGVGGNPVDFPRLAFVGRKCLLESA